MTPALTLTSSAMDGLADDTELGNRPGPAVVFAYRRRLIRALNLKANQDGMEAGQYWKLRRAASQPGYMRAFIREIDKVAKIAGDWVEDLQEWLTKLWAWLIENWDTVLKIALSLLMLAI